ncbi:MAG: hypothetical protein JXR07_12620 [Reichenbachiella sp.]
MKSFFKAKNRIKVRILIWTIIILLFPYNILISKTLLQFFFKEKVWVHKVNTAVRYASVKDVYSGIEIDLVYDSGKFDIHHPPELKSGFTLTEFLKESSRNSALKYWLDFKNLSNDNHIESMKRLVEIIEQFGLERSKVIVESSQLQFLSLFKDAGFKIAFYLPNEIRNLPKEELNTLGSEISKVEELLISSDYRDYYVLSSEFPDSSKILWVSAIWTPYGIFGIRKIVTIINLLLDEKVEVLLLP